MSYIRIAFGLAFFLHLMSFGVRAPSQSAIVVQHIEPRNGITQLSEDISVPEENAGYTLILPTSGKAKAVIIMFNSGRDTSNAGYEMRIYTEAVQRDVAMLYLTTGNRFEFLFEDSAYVQLDAYIHKAVTEYNLPSDRMLFCGMSLAGTRAMKFAIWCMMGKSEHGTKPKAVAVCDAPLDFVRFWRELDRAKRLQLSPVAVSEATWVTAVLERNLRHTPKDNPEAYYEFSPFCHELDNGGHVELLRSTAFRAYTEPDVQWWIENRGKDYYSMNALDAAAAVNQLRILGNSKAELMLTSGKGKHPDGRRHPHSWSIVDNGELVEWLLKLE
jgi:hypothetical protein